MSEKCPKPEISPNAEPLDAGGAARRIRFVAWQRLSDFASVLGEQQRHQLIDRCRQVAAGRGAASLPLSRRAQVVNRKPKYHRLKQM